MNICNLPSLREMAIRWFERVSLLAHTAVREVKWLSIILQVRKMRWVIVPYQVWSIQILRNCRRGRYEREALQAAGILIEPLETTDGLLRRFVAENEGVNGVCKVLTAEDGTVLGGHMLGNPASRLIVLAGMACEDGKTIEDWKRY